MVVLSKTMTEVLEIMKQHNNKLIRWKHGFWTYEGCFSRYQSNAIKYGELEYPDKEELKKNTVYRDNIEFKICYLKG